MTENKYKFCEELYCSRHNWISIVCRRLAKLPLTLVLAIIILTSIIFFILKIEDTSYQEFTPKFLHKCLATIEILTTSPEEPVYEIQPLCPGIPLNSWWVLCSASCFRTNPTLTHSMIDINSQQIRTEKIILHPEHSFITGENDIALIKVKKPISIDQSQCKFKLDVEPQLGGVIISLISHPHPVKNMDVRAARRTSCDSKMMFSKFKSQFCLRLDNFSFESFSRRFGGLYLQVNKTNGWKYVSGLLSFSTIEFHRATKSRILTVTDVHYHQEWINSLMDDQI